MKRILAFLLVIFLAQAVLLAQTASKNKNYRYLGKLSANKYDPESVSNKFGPYGNPYGETINNPFSKYGSPYSPYSPNSKFSTGQSSPVLIADDGTYLGRLNSNPYEPESVSNRFGPYGSPYSPNSINNEFGKYGSRFSPFSPNNPYTLSAPKIYSSENSGIGIINPLLPLGSAKKK